MFSRCKIENERRRLCNTGLLHFEHIRDGLRIAWRFSNSCHDRFQYLFVPTKRCLRDEVRASPFVLVGSLFGSPTNKASLERLPLFAYWGSQTKHPKDMRSRIRRTIGVRYQPTGVVEGLPASTCSVHDTRELLGSVR